MTITEFQQRDGAMWYSLINGELFKRALQCAEDNSPAKFLSTVGNAEIKEHGAIIAGQIQGYNEAISFFTKELVILPQAPLPDPSYERDDNE